jgi:hypothetical protein
MFGTCSRRFLTSITVCYGPFTIHNIDSQSRNVRFTDSEEGVYEPLMVTDHHRNFPAHKLVSKPFGTPFGSRTWPRGEIWYYMDRTNLKFSIVDH